jgi:hypothetical protein
MLRALFKKVSILRTSKFLERVGLELDSCLILAVQGFLLGVLSLDTVATGNDSR